MYGWEVTFHKRAVVKWDSNSRKYDRKAMQIVEARKSFGGVNVLLIAREDGTFTSMNGTAPLTWADLQQMASVTSDLEKLLVQRTRNV